MSEQINERIRRIYAAINEAVTTDPSEFKSVTKHIGGNTFTTSMDFQGTVTPEQMQNIIYNAIYNVANFRDHLRKWARSNDKDPDAVDKIVENSPELKVIIDLSNRDKHGGDPRKGGLSGHSPTLANFRRAVIFRGVGPGKEKPSMTVSLFSGTPEVQFHGGAHVRTDADVLSKSGDRLGDVMTYLEVGVSKWEQALLSWGLDVREEPT